LACQGVHDHGSGQRSSGCCNKVSSGKGVVILHITGELDVLKSNDCQNAQSIAHYQVFLYKRLIILPGPGDYQQRFFRAVSPHLFL
jgi:hypothetical protein